MKSLLLFGMLISTILWEWASSGLSMPAEERDTLLPGYGPTEGDFFLGMCQQLLVAIGSG